MSSNSFSGDHDLPHAPEAYDDQGQPHEAYAGDQEQTWEEAPAHPWELAIAHEFQTKDKNGDGFLSMKEITLKELLELDVDHNGFISYDEFYGVFSHKSQQQFIEMDFDQDDRLRLAEFAKGDITPALELSYNRFAADPVEGMTLDEYRNFLAEHRPTAKR